MTTNNNENREVIAERRTGMSELISAERRTKIFISVFGALLTIIAGGVWDKLTSMGGSLKSMETTIDLVLHDSLIFSEYRKTHKIEAAYQIAKIDKNFESIHDLINNVNARKDGFSGSDARDMERRMDRRIDKIERCCGIFRYKNSDHLLDFDQFDED